MKYPFTPELLDSLPEELAELYRSLELKLLDEICSRLKIAGAERSDGTGHPGSALPRYRPG